MPPLDGEQLGAEAAELLDDLAHADTPGAPPGGAQPEPEPQLEQEHIPNPAPKIAGALKMARGNALVRKVTPPRVLAVFDDATCDALGDAIGPLAMKWWPSLTPSFTIILDEWKEELHAAAVLYVVGSAVVDAMKPDAERADAQPGAQPGGARNADRDYVDPPNPASGVPPVEPMR